VGSDNRPAAGGTAPRLGENTRAVHLPPPPVPSQQPLGTPVYRTAAFAFESSA
jgi:O-acetylhomoserine/O-acetylserine sulfhydrylase-like pyridoxal-dependent enzyme